MKLFKNQWINIILAVIIFVMLIPQTRKPIAIFVNKVFSFSPSVTEEEDRKQLADYNWTLEKNTGEKLAFSDYKGEVILVNYWATWCPPCIAEMPSFQDLYEDYQDKISFFFVSGEDHETVNNFLKRKGYSLPSYRMLSTDPKPMNGYTLPTTYLIDKEANIVIHKTGAANWNSTTIRNTLDKLLAE